MPCLRSTLICLGLLIAASSLPAQITKQNNQQPAASVTSPNGQVALLVFDTISASKAKTSAAGEQSGLRYAVEFHGKRLIAESQLGLELAGQPALGPGMVKTTAQPATVDQTYTIPVGKTSSVRDHYNAVSARFSDPSGRKLTIEMRAYDDGVAFRYSVPDQPSLKQVRIAHELTQFNFPQDTTSWPLILDGYQSSWEDEYQQRQIGGLHQDWLIGLPLLTEEPGKGWLAITEANIDNYAGMYLRKDSGFGAF